MINLSKSLLANPGFTMVLWPVGIWFYNPKLLSTKLSPSQQCHLSWNEERNGQESRLESKVKSEDTLIILGESMLNQSYSVVFDK